MKTSERSARTNTPPIAVEECFLLSSFHTKHGVVLQYNFKQILYILPTESKGRENAKKV